MTEGFLGLALLAAFYAGRRILQRWDRQIEHEVLADEVHRLQQLVRQGTGLPQNTAYGHVLDSALLSDTELAHRLQYDAAVADARIADGIHDARQRGYHGATSREEDVAYKHGRYYGYYDGRARRPAYESVPAERYADDSTLRHIFINGYDDGYAEGWTPAQLGRS